MGSPELIMVAGLPLILKYIIGYQIISINTQITLVQGGQYENNNGFIYGIEHQDQNGNVIDVEWFKSEKERNREVNNDKTKQRQSK